MKSIKNFERLSHSLDEFMIILNELLPRYTALCNKVNLNQEENEELGAIEHRLIVANAKITELKNSMDQHLFGHIIDTYYKMKEDVKNGDHAVKVKFESLKQKFTESLLQENLINWN